jgi:hypothetical protein
MLPVHTNTTRKGATSLAVMISILAEPTPNVKELSSGGLPATDAAPLAWL